MAMSPSAATAAPPAAMDTFIRLKVILSAVDRGSGQQKMMAVAGTTRWAAFRSAAAQKFECTESDGALEFLWEGCCIDEPDHQCIGSFLKDGDTLVMVATGDLQGSQCATNADQLPAVKDEAHDMEERSAGALTRDASTSGEAINGRPTALPRRTHAPRGSAGPSNHHPSKTLLSIRDVPHAELSEDDDRPRDTNRRLPSDKARPSMQSLPPLPSTRPASQGDASLVRQGSGGDQDKKCTCKHSKCVKLYCICWSAGVLCNSCLCQDCFNKPENEDFIRAEQSRIRSRNPMAFSLKVEQGRHGGVSHKVGCRCRRSQCIKKYCECFDGGVKCSSNCRCTDCLNQPEDRPRPREGEEGLALLASAGQMATGGPTEEPFQLTPGTAAAVAPYHALSSSLPHCGADGMADGTADGAWPGKKQAQRMRHASDGEDAGEHQAVGKKRRSSSNSSTGALAAARDAGTAGAGGPPGGAGGGGSGGGGGYAPPGIVKKEDEKLPNKFLEGPQAERAPASQPWHDGIAWAGPGSGSAGDAGATAANSSQAASDGSYESEGAVRDFNIHSGPSTAPAPLPARPTALPRPTGRHPGRAWSGPAPAARGTKGSGQMRGGGGSILHHLQQQQQQMEAYMLHQQQAATMMAMSGADMGVMYPGVPLSRAGYSYLMASYPAGPGGMMMMPMLSSMNSHGTSMGLPSPRAMVDEEPMGAAQG